MQEEVRSILKSERKQVILEEINHHQVVSLDSLVRLLNTSESTVRRDLDELEDESCAGFTVEQKAFISFKRKKAIKKNLSKTFKINCELLKKRRN